MLWHVWLTLQNPPVSGVIGEDAAFISEDSHCSHHTGPHWASHLCFHLPLGDGHAELRVYTDWTLVAAAILSLAQELRYGQCYGKRRLKSHSILSSKMTFLAGSSGKRHSGLLLVARKPVSYYSLLKRVFSLFSHLTFAKQPINGEANCSNKTLDLHCKQVFDSFMCLVQAVGVRA